MIHFSVLAVTDSSISSLLIEGCRRSGFAGADLTAATVAFLPVIAVPVLVCVVSAAAGVFPFHQSNPRAAFRGGFGETLFGFTQPARGLLF